MTDSDIKWLVFKLYALEMKIEMVHINVASELFIAMKMGEEHHVGALCGACIELSKLAQRLAEIGRDL